MLHHGLPAGNRQLKANKVHYKIVLSYPATSKWLVAYKGQRYLMVNDRHDACHGEALVASDDDLNLSILIRPIFDLWSTGRRLHSRYE